MSEPWDEVAKHLGSSIAWEEHKGDFNRARRCARRLLRDARRDREPERVANALLARAIVDSMAGELAAAGDALDQAEGLSEDPSLRLRIANHRLLLHRHKLLRFPDGTGYPTSDLAELWSPVRDNAWLEQAQRRHGSEVDDRAAGEAFFLRQVLFDLHSHRYLSSALELMSADQERARLTTWVGALLAFCRIEGDRGANRPDRMAYAQRMIADALWRHQQPEPASEHLQSALEAYRSIDDRAGEAGCLLTSGDRLLSPDTSPLTWGLPIGETASANVTPWVPRRRVEASPSEPAEALRGTYRRAQELFASAGARRGVAATALRLGYLSVLDGAFDDAHQRAEQALELFEESGDQYGVQLAMAHRALTRLAVDAHRIDLAAAEQIGSWGASRGSYSFSLGLGYFFSKVGSDRMIPRFDYSRALACHRLAQAVFASLEAPMAEAQSLADQATVLRLLRDVPAAAVRYERAIDLYTAKLQHRIEASAPEDGTAGGLDELSDRLRDSPVILWQRAVLLADTLCAIYQMVEETDGLERSLERLTRLYDQKPDPHDPGLFGEAFPDTLDHAIQRRQLFMRFWILALNALDLRRHDRQTRSAHLDQALALARSVETEDRYFLEATVHRLAKRFPEAVAAFEAYLAQGGIRAGFTGRLAERLAEQFGGPGQQVVDDGEVENHKNAALFFARCRDFERAAQHLQHVETAAGSEWWRRTERPWEALGLYGEIAEGRGQLEDAIARFETAISYLETRHQSLYRDELKTRLLGTGMTQQLFFGATRAAVKLALEAGSQDENRRPLADRVIGFAARGKARSLHDLVVEMKTYGDLEASRREKLLGYRRLSAQLAVWNQGLAEARMLRDVEQSRLEELTEQIERGEQELMQQARELFSSPGGLAGETPLRMRDVVDNLAPHSAVIEFYFLDDDFLAWGITSEGAFRCHHQALDVRDLTRDVHRLHRICATGRPLGTLADKLGEMILGPLAEVLDAVDHLIIIPFGAAHRLPFHCLTWHGEPLGARHTISYLPTVGLLRLLRRWRSDETSGAGPSLVVGNPRDMIYRSKIDRRETVARRLPAAEVEAQYVSRLIPAATTLIGEAATKDAVLRSLADAQLVHFATHGALSESDPLLSSLLLADGEDLTVLELAGLRIDARLVVLSACNTAAGKATRGDDLLGLTRGVLASGAEAAVVSLWPVHDLSTSLLMGAFYRHLGGGAPPSEALHAAQTYLRELTPAEIERERSRLATELTGDFGELPEALMREDRSTGRATHSDFSHPFYWASFVVAGLV